MADSTVHVRLDSELRKDLHVVMEREGLTLSQAIRLVLYRGLGVKEDRSVKKLVFAEARRQIFKKVMTVLHQIELE